MPVLFFQAFIVGSIFFVKKVSPRQLPHVAVAWSCFTLIMVFMPWLMALQLAVIWGAFLWLRRESAV